MEKKPTTYLFTVTTADGKTFSRKSKNPNAYRCASVYKVEGETLVLGWSRSFVLAGARVATFETETGIQAETLTARITEI